MSVRVAADAEHLPREAAGSRATGWWAIVLLIVIELVLFVSLIASYFFLRGRVETWPPAGLPPPAPLWPVVDTVLLAAGVGALWLGERAIRRDDQVGLRQWLAVALGTGVLLVGLLGFEYASLPYRWWTHAYGSLVFTMIGLFLTHLLAGLVWVGAVLVLAWQGWWFSARRYLAIQTAALYWAAALAIWVPLALTIYLAPYLI